MTSRANTQPAAATGAASPVGTGAVALLGAVAMAVVLVLSGLMACVLPSSTWLLSSAFSDDATSPYERAQLVDGALAGRAYTVAEHDREALEESLDDLLWSLGWEASYVDEEGKTRGLITLPREDRGEAYTLTDEAISHLDDVWNVLQPVYAAYTAAVIVAGACVLSLARHVRWSTARRALAAMLAAPAVVVLAAFAAFACWAAVDFSGLFETFHSLFFAAGSWTFSYESLLICMYPIAFWVGMAAIWLVVTAAGCAGCIAVARRLARS